MANNVNARVRPVVTLKVGLLVWQQQAKLNRLPDAAFFAEDDKPLFDLLPEPAAIGNIWENKLALIECKRIGAIVSTER